MIEQIDNDRDNDRARFRIAPACLIVLTLAAGTLMACGKDSPNGPLGSPENPATPRESPPSVEATGQPGTSASGRTSGSRVVPTRPQKSVEPPSETRPGYRDLVRNQSSKPKTRATPCAFVTKAQAQTILGTALLEPQEAAQGPTCIYRNKTGKQFVTVAMQSVDFRTLRPHIRNRKRITVSDKIAYCGTYGRPSLYLPLSRGRVLSVSASCAIARQFAIRAVPRLKT